MWTKICGFTTPQNAVAACRPGLSAIGLNFFSGSKRFVGFAQAVEIARAVRENLKDAVPEIVGVFVNSSSEDVAKSVSQVNLSAVQFHGDESCSLISDFHRLQPEVRIIRALRVNEDNFASAIQSIRELCDIVPISACLLDAYSVSHFGGTGQTINLDLVAEYLADESLPRLILAGGLTPDNVDSVLAQVRPWGVDVASGVESSPGIKDLNKVERFLSHCRAFTDTRSTVEQSLGL